MTSIIIESDPRADPYGDDICQIYVCAKHREEWIDDFGDDIYEVPLD